MSESVSSHSIAERNNMYPEPVVFDEHYTMMLVAFNHQVNWSGLSHETRRNTYAKALANHQWQVHDYFVSEKDDQGENQRKGLLRFQPEKIMTPHAHEVLFGETLFKGEQGNESDISAFISDRLNPDIGTVGLSESLMFSLGASTWLNKPLIARDTSLRNPIEYTFKIHWVDMFLYNDGTGMLAIKVQSLSDKNGIDELSLMNRTLRDFKNANLTVQIKDSEQEAKTFWNDVVFHDWLAFDEEIEDDSWFNKLSADESVIAKGLLLIDAENPKEAFDRFQRYCKTMVVAKAPDISEGEIGMLWGRPLSDPPVYYSDQHYQALEEGQWNVTLAASQKAIGAGYATVRDLILFEIATVSSEQASTGWKGGRGWEYSLEYVRKVVDNNLIEIWEYWAGMALRDTCVFVSYDKSMPIMWQAESYYYPLYMLAYHNRFKLDCMSQSIIDYDMADALHGRKVRDDFQRFRNHYWFQDVTTDFQGVEVYQQMQHGMGLNEQYETVASEIADVSDHLQEKWDRGTRGLLTGLAILFAPLMEVWNTWVIPKVKAAPVEVLAQIAGGIVLALLLLLMGWLKFRIPIMAQVRKVSRKVRRMIGVMGNK